MHGYSNLFLLQNIDCGYRGGSNMYPQFIFGAKIRKILNKFLQKKKKKKKSFVTF